LVEAGDRGSEERGWGVSRSIEVKVHVIAEDGLPDRDDRELVGRVAFIFDGCVVSGWPLGAGEDADQGYIGLWEGNSDVARNVRFANVTHWLEFPEPVWQIDRGDTPGRGDLTE
jgi:hypothetical protein